MMRARWSRSAMTQCRMDFLGTALRSTQAAEEPSSRINCCTTVTLARGYRSASKPNAINGQPGYAKPTLGDDAKGLVLTQKSVPISRRSAGRDVPEAPKRMHGQF